VLRQNLELLPGEFVLLAAVHPPRLNGSRVRPTVTVERFPTRAQALQAKALLAARFPEAQVVSTVMQIDDPALKRLRIKWNKHDNRGEIKK
jgi:hypothetical protein